MNEHEKCIQLIVVIVGKKLGSFLKMYENYVYACSYKINFSSRAFLTTSNSEIREVRVSSADALVARRTGEKRREGPCRDVRSSARQ